MRVASPTPLALLSKCHTSSDVFGSKYLTVTCDKCQVSSHHDVSPHVAQNFHVFGPRYLISTRVLQVECHTSSLRAL